MDRNTATSLMLRLALLSVFLLTGCDAALFSGPSAEVTADGVRVEIGDRALEVTNQRAEPIYAVAYGEWAMIYVDPLPQSPEHPGLRIEPGATGQFPYDADGSLLREDSRYSVQWITLQDGEIGESGGLFVER